MSEQDINVIIAKNISKYLEKLNKTQIDLADYLGVSQAAVSNWCQGIKVPRMDKIDKICKFFNVKRSQIMEDSESGYYMDPDAAEMAQELYERPEMRVLFDASRKATKEDIEQVAEILKKLGGK